MLRVYGHAESINVRKVLWTCEELALAFEREDWGGVHRSTSDPTFLALTPVGMVPVIDDDGLVLWESNTIIRYLAASRGRTDLLPVEPRSRAHVEKWMDFQASDLNNSWRVAFQGLVRKHPDHQDPAAIARSAAGFSRMVEIIDATLATSGGYLTGSALSLADIPMGLSIHRWRALPVEKPMLRHVEAYYERLCERPGFQRYGRDGGP